MEEGERPGAGRCSETAGYNRLSQIARSANHELSEYTSRILKRACLALEPDTRWWTKTIKRPGETDWPFHEGITTVQIGEAVHSTRYAHLLSVMQVNCG